MNANEAEQVLNVMQSLSRARRSEAPDLSDALLLRASEGESPSKRAEDALCLLAINALWPTQADLNASLLTLGRILTNDHSIVDVVFFEPRTDHQVRLRDPEVLPETDDSADADELRRLVATLLPPQPDEFRPDTGTSNS